MNPQDELASMFAGWLEIINQHLDTSLQLDADGRLCLQMDDILVGLELSVAEGVYRIYSPLLEIRDQGEISVLAEALSLNLDPHAIGAGSIGLDTESGWIVYSMTQAVASSGPEMLALQMDQFPAMAEALRGCLKVARDQEAHLTVAERVLLERDQDSAPGQPAPHDLNQSLA